MIPVIEIVLSSYALLTTIGLIVACLFLYFRMEKYNISFGKIIFYIIISGIFLLICSRLVFVFSIIPSVIDEFSFMILWENLLYGGIVFYGGLIGFLIGIVVCAKIKKDNVTEMLNFFTPAIPLFHLFGRIGCFLGGCCYGVESSWGASRAAEPNLIRFPVQLVEASCNLIIFIILIICIIKNPKAKLVFIYLISYSICRFILEFFRGDLIRGHWGVFSTSQVISICVLIFCIIYMIRDKKRKITL